MFLFITCTLACKNTNHDVQERLARIEQENRNLKEQIEESRKNEELEREIRELEEKNNNLEKRNNELRKATSKPKVANSNNRSTQGGTKYAYVKMIVETPVMNSYVVGHEQPSLKEWEKYVYHTEVVTINNYNKDKKFNLMDRAESQTLEELKMDPTALTSKIYLGLSPKVTQRNAFVFGSYTEASKHRRNSKTNNY